MLTLRQQAFVSEYIVCKNGSEAARRAKYSEKTAYQIAYENLRKPEIIAAIAAEEAKLAKKLEIDREAIVGGIIGAIATARQDHDGGNMIRGYSSLAKLLGLDKPETQSGVPSTESAAQRAKLEGMTDEQLIAIIEGNQLIN
jgi:phage terminase small subunit